MVPPFSCFIYSILLFLIEYLQMLQALEYSRIPPPFPFQALMAFLKCFEVLLRGLNVPPNVILRRHYNGNRGLVHINPSVWNKLAINPEYFWLLFTGETPRSLMNVVEQIGHDIEMRVRNCWHPRRRVLMTFIWLRQYLTLCNLGSIFGVSASTLCGNLYTILPIIYNTI